MEQQREAAGAKPKRKRSVRRDLSGETAAEAVNNMLQSKKLSKKINYENVKMLFQETELDTGEPAAPVRVLGVCVGGGWVGVGWGWISVGGCGWPVLCTICPQPLFISYTEIITHSGDQCRQGRQRGAPHREGKPWRQGWRTWNPL